MSTPEINSTISAVPTCSQGVLRLRRELLAAFRDNRSVTPAFNWCLQGPEEQQTGKMRHKNSSAPTSALELRWVGNFLFW